MSKHNDSDPDESIQSQGGKARAESLTPEERKNIAKKAAAARWGTPQASHGGLLKIGPYANCQCYNVEIDGESKRLISQNSFMTIVGIMGSGNAGAKRIAHLLDNPYMPPKKVSGLKAALTTPHRFMTPERILTCGYEGKLIVDYCKAMMELRRLGGLPEYAIGYAEACEAVVISLAGVAIAAIIDEATGFQLVRERNALAALLDRYLQNEFSAWAKRFPDDFYQELFRLRGWEWKGMKVNRPQCVGNDTKDLVYSRLEVGILKELEIKNPWIPEKNKRQGYHHSLLTDDFGVPALAQHLHTIITIMRGFPDGKWQRFKEFLDVTMPKKGDSVQFLLDLNDT